MYTICLDWLSVTFKGQTHAAHNFLATYANSGISQPSTALFGYSTATRDENNVVRMWHDSRSDMGEHAIFSGSSLKALHNIGRETPEILREAIKSQGKISRLDLAVDIVGESFSGQLVKKALEKTGNQGTARSYSTVEGHDGGFTLYVGSRQSERFVRIYDKAVQSGEANMDWWRYELETKGDVARALANLLAGTPDERWLRVFIGLGKGVLNVRASSDLSKLYAQEQASIGLPKIERTSDVEKWIDTQVTSALLRHFIANRASPAIKRLRDALELIDRQQS
jgi:hypothetical protein